MQFKFQQWQTKITTAAQMALIATGFVIPLSITAYSILFALTVLLAILSGNYKEKINMLSHNPVVGVFLLFFALLLVSITYSTAPWHEINQTLGKYEKLLYIVFLLPLFTDKKWQRVGINAFLAAMIVTVLTAFVKMFGWIHMGNSTGLGTLYNNHIKTGFMVAFAAFIFLHRYYDTRDKWRWLYLFLFLLMSYHTFFMNEGRTGYLVYFALAVLFLWQRYRWRGLTVAIAMVPVMLVALYFISQPFQQGVKMANTDMSHYHQHQLTKNSIGLRVVFTKNSLTLIKEHPWIGTGVGSFRTEYNKQFPPQTDFVNMGNPQNEYLMMWVQLGVVGVIAFLLIFAVQWRTSLKIAAEFKNVAQGMIVAFMVGCLCDSFLYLAVTSYLFVYFSALLYARLPRTHLNEEK